MNTPQEYTQESLTSIHTLPSLTIILSVQSETHRIVCIYSNIVYITTVCGADVALLHVSSSGPKALEFSILVLIV